MSGNIAQQQPNAFDAAALLQMKNSMIQELAPMISNRISAAVETIKEHSTSENRSRKLEDWLAENPSLTERAKAARVSESYEWKKEGLGKQYERVVKCAEYLERAAHVLPADLQMPSDAFRCCCAAGRHHCSSEWSDPLEVDQEGTLPRSIDTSNVSGAERCAGSEHSYKWMEYLRAVDREDYKVADLVFGSDCLSPELLKSVDEAARSVERETGKAEKAKAAKAAAQKGTL